MQKQASYSKYQKKVIKFLSDTLGLDTPFSYEKAQNNHLKVLIEGVSSPLYTGSTPSDTKAINNFMAEVKRKVAQSKQQENDEDSEAKVSYSFPIQHSLDKTIQTCLKSLRTRIDTMKQKEEELVLSSQTLTGLKDYRLNEIKNAIKLAQQAQKATVYLKPKEVKHLELKILEHIDFWMPTLAYYANLLDGEENTVDQDNAFQVKTDEVQVEQAKLSLKKEAANDVPSLQEVGAHKEKKEVVPALMKSKAEKKPVTNKIKKHSDPVFELTNLMAMSSTKRVNLLRTLSKNQSLQLIDELSQALSLNREQDILEVVELMKQKGLNIKDIMPKLDLPQTLCS